MNQMTLAIYQVEHLTTQARIILSEFKQLTLNRHSYWIYPNNKINYKNNLNDNHIIIYISMK